MNLSKFVPKIDPRILNDLRTQKKPISIGLVCATIASLLYSSTVVLTKDATDAVKVIVTAVDPKTRSADDLHAGMLLLAHACGAVLVIFLIRYFLTRIQMIQLARASNQLAAELRQRLFGKLLRLPIGYFNEARMGAIQSSLTNDVNVYQFAINIIQDSINGPIRAIAAFGMILYVQPYLMPFAIVLVGVMVAYIQHNAKKMKAAQAKVQASLADLNAETDERLQGIRVIRAFGAEQLVMNDYRKLINQTLDHQMEAATVLANLKPLVDLIGAAGLAAVLFIAGRIAAEGRLGVGDIAAMALAMDMINQGFKSVASLSSTMAQVTAASDRIYSEILEVPEESSAQIGTLKPAQFSGQIEFEDVCFDYPDGTRALNGVTFTIAAGKSLALVGPSGAGKSTIADLLLRFYSPTSGRILVDGIDIAKIDSQWLRSRIGVVPQQTFLFAGAIEDNVRLAKPDATAAEVRSALESAHADQFAQELSERSNSDLGERGVKLSGGQMQRVAIARALVRKPTILLLDEATSALDARSESIVTEALTEVMRERTTVLIAHRLTTAARADQILYLKNGAVVETGTHTALMHKNGEYAALFRLFSGGVIDVPAS